MHMRRFVPLFLVLLAACSSTPANEPSPVVRTDDRDPLGDAIDWPPELPWDGEYPEWRIYEVEQTLRVVKDDVVIDFAKGRDEPLRIQSLQSGTGTTRSLLTQTGIRLGNRRNVTIRNLDLVGFKIGILIEDCESVTIENCRFSRMFSQYLHSDANREAGSDWLWPHNNDNGEWAENYGAAIYLKNCRNSRVLNCQGREGQNGIILDRCTKCVIMQNDFSYHSGWGCALWRSSDNIVNSNRFDYCVRGYSHGVYARGQDSAGILVFEQCNNNWFAYNSATHSGDGFFLYAGHETTQRTGEGGCNGNNVCDNDFSYAVANGIEATFSDRNRFSGNRMIGCDYGIWAGYSYNTLIADNLVTDSLTAGVAIEHGHDNAVIHNVFRNNRRAIWLWWDDDKEFLQSIYGQQQSTESTGNTVTRNQFDGDRTAVMLERTTQTLVRGNEFRGCDVVLEAKGDCSGGEITDCNVYGGEFKVSDEANRFKLSPLWHSEFDAGKANPVDLDLSRREVWDWDHSETEFQPPAWASMKKLLWGRESIIIGVHGPLDAMEPAVVEAPGEVGAWYVLGGPDPAHVEYSVAIDYGEVEIERFSGKVPCGFRLRPKNAGVTQFVLGVQLDGHEYGLYGTVAKLDWQVEFWEWQPVEGQDGPADWDALVAGAPVKTVQTQGLDYMLQGGAPEEGVPAEFFATVATTTLNLEQGLYRLHVTSDDGVRVYIDDKLLLDNWGIHGPTTDIVTIAAGKRTIRVEHFQRQGWAALKVEFEGW
jgi:parallel beta-helix repeat protein